MRKLARGVESARRRTLSRVRVMTLEAQFPTLQFRGRVLVGPACRIHAGQGSALVIGDCAIAPFITLTVSPGVCLDVQGDFVGPGSQIVAREPVEIGGGAKIAEYVTLRDANHDRSVPLAEKRFISAPVVIGRDVWIGAESATPAVVGVGGGVTVPPSADMTKDVLPGTGIGGVPAKKLCRHVEEAGA